MDEPLLSVRDLSVDYLTTSGPVHAIERVSFDVGPGEIVGLAGESGSGKSTLVQAAMRILGPPGVICGGRVLFRGRDVLAMDEPELRGLRWREIAMVFQSAMDALNPVLTIGEQLSDTILAHERVPGHALKARVRELLELVDVDPDRAGSYPHQLSGGMRQRVVIAIALALEPPLVIMDEPTTALDVVVERAILSRILDLRDRLGFSILFITHDLPLMLELCDRMGILYDGRQVELAPVPALKAAPRHPYTRGLLASFPSLHGPREALQGIPGSPPSVRDSPPGCRFAPRCSLADARCRALEPPLEGAEHRVRCYNASSAISSTPQGPEPGR